MDEKQRIREINIRLDTIATINSFSNDGKTYYITLLDKEENDISQTLKKHFNVKNWTFDLTKPSAAWNAVLRDELIYFFGQYIWQAKSRFLENEANEKNKQGLLDDFIKETILNGRTCFEYLLNNFIDDLGKIIGENYSFYKLQVNWTTDGGKYESWYELYENDYLFDLGEKVLFLHFGASD